ncbi:FAD binding domain protein [Stachybotrys elegans]|uniref:FAD binding domain protein n=1 Tax=Stachybotrys elegans TaxID=80388 RepID=A0A8K0SFW9_9HYPO|nr:FAD binding domain protein [Stachybotrys elegans]
MPDSLKVIIAGGGVAGLTMAIMLEKFDIDYVILEAYSKIAPPVGASVGLFPNGLRILDQLGCFDEIKRKYNLQQRGNTCHRDKRGKLLAALPDEAGQYEVRHGYPLLFFERTGLLEILYETVRHKDRVLVNKRVASVDMTDHGVVVHTADGASYPGTFLLGADGVHSAVRSVMTSLAADLEPGYFSGNEADEVACHYICDFGIAQNVPGWTEGDTNMVQGDGRAAGVVSGPDHMVYWFFTEKLPQTRYGADIPRFSAADEAAFTKRHANFRVTENVTFGDVIKARKTSTLTPLHEIVHKKWFFRRIIALGDSVHKPNPVGGQGANGAMESCAELLNALLDLRARRGGHLDGLTTPELVAAFRQTQHRRHERAHMIVDAAHEVQFIMAHENPLVSYLAMAVVLPNAGNELMLTKLGDIFSGGSSIRHLPMPNRRREVPFNDELPAQPATTAASRAVLGLLIGSMGLVALSTYATLRLPAAQLGAWGPAQQPLLLGWFGTTSLNAYFNRLVSAVSLPILDSSPMPRMQLLTYLSTLISPLLVYTVEGYRLGNQGTPLALPILMTAGIPLFGFARVAPLHAIFTALCTHKFPTGRAIPAEVASSLIPALTLSYLVPAVMSMTPTANVGAWQSWVGLSVLAPPMFSLATYAMAAAKRWWSRRPMTQQEKLDAEYDRYKQLDLASLKTAYTFAFAIQAAAHISTMIYCYTQPGVSIYDTFFAVPNPLRSDWGLTSLSAAAATYFKYNLQTGVVASVVSNLYSIWNMRSIGYITTGEALSTAAKVALGQVLVGPGATWTALWRWRENKLTTLGAWANERREKAALALESTKQNGHANGHVNGNAIKAKA